MTSMSAGEQTTQGLATELVLYAGCLPATPFREFVAAAASAEFDAITLWPLMYRRAQSREGLDPATMRRIVDDAGLRITDIDSCGDWLPAPVAGGDVQPAFRSVWSRHEFFAAAAALGADTLVAVHLTGDDTSHDLAVEGFASLCDDAAEHGLRIALEFIPFSGVRDLAAGWSIVRESGRANSGLVFDVCHVVRSGSDTGLLQSIPAERILSVQLGDGSLAAPADLVDEAMYHRALPGDGEFGVGALLGQLCGLGVRSRVGPELYQTGWSQRPAAEVAADLMDATRRILTASSSSP